MAILCRGRGAFLRRDASPDVTPFLPRPLLSPIRHFRASSSVLYFVLLCHPLVVVGSGVGVLRRLLSFFMRRITHAKGKLLERGNQRRLLRPFVSPYPVGTVSSFIMASLGYPSGGETRLH